jgi:hypothetical protein
MIRSLRGSTSKQVLKETMEPTEITRNEPKARPALSHVWFSLFRCLPSLIAEDFSRVYRPRLLSWQRTS